MINPALETETNLEDDFDSACDAGLDYLRHKDVGPKGTMSIHPIPDTVRADILCLGEYLYESHPTNSATAYVMVYGDNPEIFESLGELVEGNYLVFVRVRDEKLYQQGLKEWNGVYFSNSKSTDLLKVVSLVKFRQSDEIDWLNVRAGRLIPVAREAESDTKSVDVVLIGPSDATLFKFPFDEENGCALQSTMFDAENYRPYQEYSKHELEAARLATTDLYWPWDFDPTYTYWSHEDGPKLKNGTMVYEVGSREVPLLADTTLPISVTFLGPYSDLRQKDHLLWRDGTSYTCDLRTPSEHSDVFRANILNEEFLLISVNDSLAECAENDFAGFVAFRRWFSGQKDKLCIRLANRFTMEYRPSAAKDFLHAAVRSGSIPVVFADLYGIAFLVRYPFDDNKLKELRTLEQED